MNRVLGVLCLAVLLAGQGAAQDASASGPQPPPVLKELRLQGATIYKADDVFWLLRLRENGPLPADATTVATRLQERYARDGYTEARVSGAFDGGRLTLEVSEGRIDEIEILGARPDDLPRLRRLLGIEIGDVYNTRVVGRATARVVAESGGAFVIGSSRGPSGSPRSEAGPSAVTVEHRGGRNVLIVPLQWRVSRFTTTFGSGREDLYTPVDGLAPAIGFSSTLFDHGRFNHTFVNGYVSYKFARDNPGYSFGAERPLFGGPRLFLGGEVHDVTGSDDLWRISSFEQTLVALTLKNSFRDYYRRRGGQLFSVLRAGGHNELSMITRWDRHDPLPNATSYSFFRDAAQFRAPLPVTSQHVNAVVLGYTFDTRLLTGQGSVTTYARHLRDNLYGFASRQGPGLRLEWTSEIAGNPLGGDAHFNRHIFNARGYLPLSSRTLFSGRTILGASGGTLPVERLFAVGGIGSVHGYSFKQASGTRMALLNLEYAVTVGSAGHDRDPARVFVFYDAGKVGGTATSQKWLNGLGLGAGAGGVRLEFGFRANDIPGSRQILLRFSPTF